MSKTGARKQPVKEYKRILIIRLDKIGDVLLSTPAIKALRDAYPKSYIAFLARPYARQIVNGNPYLDKVLLYNKRGKEKGILGNLEFIKELKTGQFDLAVMLHPTRRSHLLAFIAGIPERLGYDRKWGFLLTKRIPHTKQFGLKSETDYTLDLLRYIGVESKDKALYMPVNTVSEDKVMHIFRYNGIKDGDIVVVVHPGASCPSKRWPARNFATVADRLAEKHRAKIIVIAGEDESAIGNSVAKAIKAGCVDLSGRTTVGDLASIFKRSSLLISNDSGPVHVACAMGTPVVAIFGRSDRGLSPGRWGPSGRDDIVLHKDVGCTICLAHRCRRGFRCLEAITSDEVLDAADRILARRHSTFKA
jgi:heptosyltransferase-2